MRYPPAVLWRLHQLTVEVPADNTLHRPGCACLADAVEVVEHPAGAELRRDAAPHECWECSPVMELVLGV
jgi:hypothetical protein